MYCGIITYVEVIMKWLCSMEPPLVCGGQQGPDNLRLFGGSHWCPRGAGDDFSLGHPENAVWGWGWGVGTGPDLGGATHCLGDGGTGFPVDTSQPLNAGRKSSA